MSLQMIMSTCILANGENEIDLGTVQVQQTWINEDCPKLASFAVSID